LKYLPKLKSVRRHEVPEWFHDAKFGIFIHWGIYSVPAFGAVGVGDFQEIISTQGIEAQFKNNPYAEWYLNTMKIRGSPCDEHHLKTYGSDFKYDDFIPKFNDAIKNWNPEEWTQLFQDAGARYVVLVTKHHDGFLLWPSKHPNPKKENYRASRDIVGELTSAVKRQGMKMGLYYSGALDWTFNEKPIHDVVSFLTNGPVRREYVDYVNAHWRELIELYEPCILWNDIGYPPGTNPYELFAFFYNKTPDGIVNDRWMQVSKLLRALAKTWLGKVLIQWAANRMIKKGTAVTLKSPHYDFLTPEYVSFKEIKQEKWETTRGIGKSFGYNAEEPDESYMTLEELIHLLVDVVSKNGNLLLNVGPMADGTIPEIQKQRLLGIGKWLRENGEAIYGTRPWIIAEGIASEEIEVRFTRKGETLHAILLGTPKEEQITLANLQAGQETVIKLLENDLELNWKQGEDGLSIHLEKKLGMSPAHAFSITPIPRTKCL